jgi:hypothetical protein
METSYTPVQYVHREVIEEEIVRQRNGKVFYFNQEGSVDCTEGTISAINEIEGKGLFITMSSGFQLRIDRIITLFGQPGAAYDEYDAYANACMECHCGFQAD